MNLRELRYLSKSDVQSLGLSYSEIADAIAKILRRKQNNAAWNNPNSTISPYEGTRSISFHAAALDPAFSVHKTLGLSRDNSARNLPHLGGLINVHDVHTGHPVAILECEEITGLRTASLSLLASRYLTPRRKAQTIGFVGAGRQASFHLEAFLSEFDLRKAILLGREGGSCSRLADECRSKGLTALVTPDWQEVLRSADIVVTSVPDGPGFKPFLDASLLSEASFVAAVDAGRSWTPSGLGSFDELVVDDIPLHNMKPYVTGVKSDGDLTRLVCGTPGSRGSQRSGFFFTGIAIADLAAVELALQKAEVMKVGTVLQR
ncbi:hypothetical protein [Phaeobacter inhibens]|uniref:hypothetical protein n=1 Tax=Phaeobacter inhibens TaxID=221822 RepID=UPI002490155E|nr:hypothetical protein [Phaeobacter inhibens]